MLPRLRASMVVVATLAATVLGGVLGVSAGSSAAAATADPRPGASAPSAMPAAGTFYPTAVQRVLGGPTGGDAVSPGSPASVTTAEWPGLPSSGVSALMVNVTASAATADVRLSFAGTGLSAPAPLVAVPASTTRSTLLTVPLATTAGFDVSATGGSASVTADVVGFYAADDTVVAGYGLSGGYQPVETTRLSGPVAVTLAPGARSLFAVDLGGGVTPHATALLVDIRAGAPAPPAGTVGTVGTAAGPESGSVSVSAPTAPVERTTLATTVSFGAGSPGGNLALVPAEVDSSGRLGLAVTNTGTVAGAYSLDLVGFYDDGAIGPNLRFRALPQNRVLDTAAGLGGLTALTPGGSGRATLGDVAVDDSTFALVGVLTATAPTPTTVGVVSPDGPVTVAAAVPVGAGTTSVAVQPEVGVGRDVAVLAGAAAPTGLTLDVVGSFEASPAVTNPAARRWVPPVPTWQISAVLQSS